MIVALIDNDNKTQFIFPISPKSIMFAREGKSINVESIVMGDIPWGRGRQAETIVLEGLWPGYKQNVPRHHYADPYQIDKEIKEILNHKPLAKELRLVISDGERSIDINMPVYLDKYDITHSGGDDTLSYTMTLKEYRAYRLKRFDVKGKKVTSADEAKRPTPPKPKTYAVKPGDTLSAITLKYTGSGARWPELYDANRTTLKSKSPHLIYPGESLKIPGGWTS